MRRVTAILLILLSLLFLTVAWAEVVGKTTLPLDSQQAQLSESSLGDVVADALRTTLVTTDFKAEVALVYAGQLRAVTIPAGDVTREKLTSALVYPEEPIVGVQLTGEQLLATLERSVSYLPKKNTSFLQVSGLTVTYRWDQPTGPRVSEVKVGKTPLVNTRKYNVAMSQKLAEGAMGYYRTFGTPPVLVTGMAMKDALAKYVQTVKTLTVTTGQRLRDVTPPAK